MDCPLCGREFGEDGASNGMGLDCLLGGLGTHNDYFFKIIFISQQRADSVVVDSCLLLLKPFLEKGLYDFDHMAILVVVNFWRTVPQTVRGRTTFLAVVNPDWREP